MIIEALSVPVDDTYRLVFPSPLTVDIYKAVILAHPRHEVVEVYTALCSAYGSSIKTGIYSPLQTGKGKFYVLSTNKATVVQFACWLASHLPTPNDTRNGGVLKSSSCILNFSMEKVRKTAGRKCGQSFITRVFYTMAELGLAWDIDTIHIEGDTLCVCATQKL